jgi:hypothetical protein
MYRANSLCASGTQIAGTVWFDAHFLEPAGLHDAGDPGSVIAIVLIAAVSSVSAQSVAPTLACVAPPGFTRFDTLVKRVAGRISARSVGRLNQK